MTRKKDKQKKSESTRPKIEEAPELKGQGASVSETEVEEKPSPEEKLAEALKLLEEKEDRFLRLAAEFDNYKKRVSREFAQLIRNANEELITGLLDILDNLDRALEAAKTSDDFESFHKGMEMISSSLRSILAGHGLEPIEARGKSFDPELHEAVMQLPSGEVEEGVVLEELSRGYKLNGKVIRHSKVVVSKGEEEEPEVETDSSQKAAVPGQDFEGSDP